MRSSQNKLRTHPKSSLSIIPMSLKCQKCLKHNSSIFNSFFNLTHGSSKSLQSLGSFVVFWPDLQLTVGDVQPRPREIEMCPSSRTYVDRRSFSSCNKPRYWSTRHRRRSVSLSRCQSLREGCRCKKTSLWHETHAGVLLASDFGWKIFKYESKTADSACRRYGFEYIIRSWGMKRKAAGSTPTT